MHGTGTDEPLAWLNGSGTGAVRYFWQNYQGSVVLWSEGANVVARYKYGPYGEPLNAANVPSFGGARFRYTGQTVLPEAQLYYYKARVYDPMMGRFLQTDPIGSKDDLNLYAYVKGDPVNRVDPTGTRNESKFRKLEREALKRIEKINNQKIDSALNKKAADLLKGLAKNPITLAVVGIFMPTHAGEGSAITDGRIPLYRVYGGSAGPYGKNDATSGTHYSLADPRTLKTKEAVRQEFALPPSWGNDLSKVMTVYASPSDINFIGPAGSQRDLETGKEYSGGGVEVLIINAQQKVIPMQNGDSGLE